MLCYNHSHNMHYDVDFFLFSFFRAVVILGAMGREHCAPSLHPSLVLCHQNEVRCKNCGCANRLYFLNSVICTRFPFLFVFCDVDIG